MTEIYWLCILNIVIVVVCSLITWNMVESAKEELERSMQRRLLALKSEDDDDDECFDMSQEQEYEA